MEDERDVTKWPLAEAGWTSELPAWVQAHAGCVDGIQRIAIVGTSRMGRLFHVEFTDDASRPDDWKIALSALGSALFENEHPGEEMAMIKRFWMFASENRLPPDRDRRLWARREELGGKNMFTEFEANLKAA